MMQPERNAILRELHRSLDERWRPEDVAEKVVTLLDLSPAERIVLEQAVRAGRENFWFTMSKDFQRPCDMTRQLKVAEGLFGREVTFSPDDADRIASWIEDAERAIGKRVDHNDFKHDRLPKEDRRKAGIDISRRQYNKRFRLAVRLERKLSKLRREQFKRALTLASKTRLAARITWQDFSSDLNTACFVAYFVARCNLRSLFTNTSQVRPYDEICDVLMERCRKQEGATNWWAIAHVQPTAEVLRHLDEEQKGVLLADYYNLMARTAAFLKELWESNEISEDMVVRRGNDSTTWNVAAGAWNRLRGGWFSLLYDLGMVEVVERVCPGKVLRLMAADVAWWHRQTGGDLHQDTSVWKELPRPWDVLQAEAACPKSLVESLCAQHGLDPVQSGWSAPRPGGASERFTPTPELVHGVAVASPLLAVVLRKAGVFSGKAIKRDIPASTVDEIRLRHLLRQERCKGDTQQVSN
jgi:hypothetical protein